MQLVDVNRPSIERQHPRPVGIGETKKKSKFRGTRKNWPNMVILNSDMFLGTVHHRTELQANTWNP